MDENIIINVLTAIIIYKLVISWIGNMVFKAALGSIMKSDAGVKATTEIKESFKEKVARKMEEQG